MSVRRTLALLLTLTTAACGGSTPAPVADAADLVILNGNVHVADEAHTIAQAVAVKGNTILKVGTTNEIKALTGPATRIIDAKGATVTPGFNDAHVHFISGGRSLRDVDLSGLNTLQEVQDKIRAFAADKPADAWLKGRGWLYTPFTNASPTKAQLDAVSGDRPAVMTCYDGHSVWVNSKVLAMAGITRATKDPLNGVIVKDPKTGEPTGHLKEAAMDLLADVLPRVTDEDRRAALKAAVAHANQFGITSIQNAGGSVAEMALYDAARTAGDLTVRAYLATSAEGGITEADVDAMDAAWKQYGDDATVRTGIVKMYADGVIESKTAAMLAPYVGTKSAGTPNMTADRDEPHRRHVRQARLAGADPRHRRSRDPHVARRLRGRREGQSRPGARTPPSPRTHRGHRRRRHRPLRRPRRHRVAAADSRRARRRQPGRAEGPVAGCDRRRNAPRVPGCGRAFRLPADVWPSAATGRWPRSRPGRACGSPPRA
jgi:hypothetical protein